MAQLHEIKNKQITKMKKIILAFLIALFACKVNAQDTTLVNYFSKAIDMCIANSPILKKNKDAVLPAVIKIAEDSVRLLKSLSNLVPSGQSVKMNYFFNSGMEFSVYNGNNELQSAADIVNYVMAHLEYTFYQKQLRVYKQPIYEKYRPNHIGELNTLLFYYGLGFIVKITWDDFYPSKLGYVNFDINPNPWNESPDGNHYNNKNFKKYARSFFPKAASAYGNGLQNNTVPKGSDSYKDYIFETSCSARGKNFKVISTVTADISKDNLEAIRAAASKMITNNGWTLNSEIKYLGIKEDVKIIGTAGRDYVVSGTALYHF